MTGNRPVSSSPSDQSPRSPGRSPTSACAPDGACESASPRTTSAIWRRSPSASRFRTLVAFRSIAGPSGPDVTVTVTSPTRVRSQVTTTVAHPVPAAPSNARIDGQSTTSPQAAPRWLPDRHLVPLDRHVRHVRCWIGAGSERLSLLCPECAAPDGAASIPWLVVPFRGEVKPPESLGRAVPIDTWVRQSPRFFLRLLNGRSAGTVNGYTPILTANDPRSL